MNELTESRGLAKLMSDEGAFTSVLLSFPLPNRLNTTVSDCNNSWS